MLELFTQTLKTAPDWSGLILRVALGTMILPHGAQKLLGWFGGYGFAGTMRYFTETVGAPWLLGAAVIFIEFFGGLFLIAGTGVRLWAALLIPVMATAAIKVHLPNGFFMNWFGNQKGEGVEFFVLTIAMALALLLIGGGRFSVDEMLTR